LNKITTGELTEWRTEFLASLSELEAAAKKGTEDVTKQIQETARAAENAATDAKAAAEKAAADARAAAKTAEEASKPGALNLTLSGDFDDEVLVSVDDIEMARSRGKTIALERVVPGLRKISAHAKKGAKDVEAALMVDVKPGLQRLELVLD
jgi:phage-related tail protein